MATLMTLPAEIRRQMFREALPEELRVTVRQSDLPKDIELEGKEKIHLIASDRIGLHDPRTMKFPSNPRISLLLINHQAMEEVSPISNPVIAAQIRRENLRCFLECCSRQHKALFAKITIIAAGNLAEDAPAADCFRLDRKKCAYLKWLREHFHHVEVASRSSWIDPAHGLPPRERFRHKPARHQFGLEFKVSDAS